MNPKTFYTLLASSTLIYLFLIRMLVFLLSSLLTVGHLPVKLLRLLILCIRALGYFMISLFIFSFEQSPWASSLVILMICFGVELQSHLPMRTTAAYSTSDSQNQRLFNLSIFLIPLVTLASAVAHLFGKNPLSPNIPQWFEKGLQHWPFQIVYGLAAIVFLRLTYVTLKHSRTMLYLLRSYIATLREGKLKRFW